MVFRGRTRIRRLGCAWQLSPSRRAALAVVVAAVRPVTRVVGSARMRPRHASGPFATGGSPGSRRSARLALSTDGLPACLARIRVHQLKPRYNLVALGQDVLAMFAP